MLENTPFNSWKSANWTFRMLAEKLTSVTSKRSENNIFKYHAVNQPLSDITTFKEEKTYVEKVYTGRQFFMRITNTSKKEYYYATGGIEMLGLDNLFTDESLLRLTFGNYEPGQVNYWFGGVNVTAYTHYDTSHNFHAVVLGRKRFLLFPPSSHTVLKLYPSIHELYRQVQTDVLNLTQPEFNELLSHTDIYEVVLTQGEVLYIPPYWFHCVVTLRPTVSLNVWSHSSAFLAMEDVYALPIPFEEVWGHVKMMRVLQHFLTVIVEDALPHYENTSLFVSEAVLSRYEPMFARLDSASNERLKTLADVFCLRSHIGKLLDMPNLHPVTKGAARISEIFKTMHPIATREINLANYFEHAAWRIVGNKNVAVVPHYFKRCFLHT